MFDVEVAMTVGPEPVIATAAGPDVWYSWISPHLLDRQQPRTVREPPLAPSPSFSPPRLLTLPVPSSSSPRSVFFLSPPRSPFPPPRPAPILLLPSPVRTFRR